MVPPVACPDAENPSLPREIVLALASGAVQELIGGAEPELEKAPARGPGRCSPPLRFCPGILFRTLEH